MQRHVWARLLPLALQLTRLSVLESSISSYLHAGQRVRGPLRQQKRKPQQLHNLYTGSGSLARRMQQSARPRQTRERQAGLPRRGPHVLRRNGAGAGASGGMIAHASLWAGWLRPRGFAHAALPRSCHSTQGSPQACSVTCRRARKAAAASQKPQGFDGRLRVLRPRG